MLFVFNPWKLHYSQQATAPIWDLAPLMEWNEPFAWAMLVRKYGEAAGPGGIWRRSNSK